MNLTFICIGKCLSRCKCWYLLKLISHCV